MQSSIRVLLLLSLLVLIQCISSPCSIAVAAPIPVKDTLTGRSIMESISSLSSMPTMVSRELDLASPIENIGFVERGLEQASRLFKRWNRDLGFAMPDDHGKAIKAFHRGHRKQGPPVVDISL